MMVEISRNKSDSFQEGGALLTSNSNKVNKKILFCVTVYVYFWPMDNLEEKLSNW